MLKAIGSSGEREREAIVDEKQWLECRDPVKMLKFLTEKPAKPGWLSCTCCLACCEQETGFCPAYRKLRLYAAACCHRIIHLLPDPVCGKALSALEDYIEGEIDKTSYLAKYEAFDTVRRSRFPKYPTTDDGAWNALYCAVHRRWREFFDTHFPAHSPIAQDRWRVAMVISKDASVPIGEQEKEAQSKLLRCIFGNPFRRITFDPSWLTPTVKALAQAIYTDRTFDAMPILGDALEEAGCTCDDILNHCRGQETHTRGCWVVDLMLGKS